MKFCNARPDHADNPVPFRSIDKAILWYILLFLALTLSACSTTDPSSLPKLEVEVNTLVRNGTSLTEVTKTLSLHGFSCREGTSLAPYQKGIFECTRDRGSLWPPYACIHRIWFEGISNNEFVSNLRVLNPVCTGF
jgi:hypothetical protein